MCVALTTQPGFDSPVWINADVTTDEVRLAFRNEPCLLCVLAKRRKEGTRHWIKKAAAKPNSKLRIKQETPEEEELIRKQLEEDQKDTKIGQIIYCDDVPVHPTSIGGKNYFFAFRDTKGRKIFTFPTKRNDDDTYLECLSTVLAFFKNLYLTCPELGIRPQTIIRTDRFKTFKSAASIK